MRALTVMVLGLLSLSPAFAANDFCVSTSGNDSNPGTAAKPFSTLDAALAAARQQAGPAHIVLRAGVYYLPRTITLTPADSGLTIESAKGEDVTLSGGRRVTGWKPYRGKILQADISKLDLADLDLRELCYNGHRQPLARTPNFDPRHPRHGGFIYNVGGIENGGATKLRYREGDLDPTKWAHPERALVTSYATANACYENCVSRLVKLDPASRILELDHGVYAFEAGDRFYVSNVLEELDAPGEWYVDPDARVLYFWPPDRNVGEVVLPSLTSAFVLQGDVEAKRYVEGVRITGLNLRDFRGAAVKMTGARDCTVAACDIRNVDIAVHLDDETHSCRVVGCDITQTGNEPIRIWGTPADHSRVSGHVIDNNYIYDFGYGDFHNMNAGVVLWACSHCQITHNVIHDGPRFGVSWNGGNDNVIAYNHIHHMNLECCDCGLIYTVTSVEWGQPDEVARNLLNRGNEIHHNLMHDAGGYGRTADGRFEYPHYSWGIYLDLYSSGWSVHDNVVYNTVLGGFMINGGVDNVAENNIFASARESQLFLEPWPKYSMSGNRFECNIVANMTPGAALYQLNGWKAEYCSFARNLVFCGGKPPHVLSALTPGAARDSWAKWQSLGQDAGSVVADPLFVDAAQSDFRLRPSSPAAKIGFRPINLTRVGNYASPDRRTWPRPEVKVFREPADYRPRAAGPQQPALRDYEDYAVGETERGAAVGEEGLGTARVTDEVAASGKHSLKFTDAAGLKYPWVPYAAYPDTIEEGVVRGGFDLRWEAGAVFVYEWRDDPAVYHLGPQLQVDAHGVLTVNGKTLLTLPSGQWVRFDVICGLGDSATGTYDLTVKLPGAAPRTFKALACDPQFTFLNQFVIMSNTDGPSVFYVDNVEIKQSPTRPSEKSMALLVLTDVHYHSKKPAPGPADLAAAVAHPGPAGERRGDLGLQLVRRALDDASHLTHLNAILALGDLVDNGAAPGAVADLAELRAELARPGLPVLAVRGNHDADLPVAGPPGEKVHRTVLGGYQFLVFTDPYDAAGHTTRSPEALQAVAEAAGKSPDLPIVALQHSPLNPVIGGSYPFMPDNREAIMAAYTKAGVMLSISGHYHPGQGLNYVDGVGYLTAPSLCEAPFRFLIVHLRGRHVDVTEHSLGSVPPS